MQHAAAHNQAISIHDSVGYWASLLARSMEVEFNKRLLPHGVTRVGFAVLGAVHFDGLHTPSVVADFLGLDRAAVTRLLDKLEREQLVVRDRSGSDRRSVSVATTAKGQALAEDLARQSRAVNRQFTTGLTDQEIEQFRTVVEKMLANSKSAAGTL